MNHVFIIMTIIIEDTIDLGFKEKISISHQQGVGQSGVSIGLMREDTDNDGTDSKAYPMERR